jgi:glycolate dehydrogenase FAD-binding subunit
VQGAVESGSDSALRPADEAALAETVADLLARGEAVELVGAGTKRALGRPDPPPLRLETAAFAGIRLYEPEELLMSAGAATPVAEIEAALAERRQMLAFEPPDMAVVFGATGRATIGGAFAANLAGPRRVRAGAARDHILGVRAVSGRGEAFKAGGRVVKNVTGYDVPKLLAGSFGTLAVMTEVTFRVLPAPETTATLLARGSDVALVTAMTTALGSPHDIAGAAVLSAAVAAQSAVVTVAAIGAPVAALRVEGFGPSVAARTEALKSILADHELGVLDRAESETLWREIRDLAAFAPAAPLGRERCVWRVAVPGSAAPEVLGAVGRDTRFECIADWGGGRIFLAVPEGGGDAFAPAVRAAAAAAGGHAVLLRATDAIRRAVPPFAPQPAALAALTARVKSAFDPHGVLNPGRMYEGV